MAGSADGMAYAMNYDVYKSMNALEAAAELDRMHCLLGGTLMLKTGAPPIAVLAGIALWVAWYAFRKRGAKAYEKN